ncbi:LuxR C-terminal-related transcriptional regulator [Streptomyces sp. NPDC054933]
MTAPAAAPVEARPAQLGARRLLMLRLVANGRSSRQIAARLDCSKEAVDKQMRVIADVLGATCRTHAVALAMARGLITPEDIEERKALSASESRELAPNAAESTHTVNSRQTAA